MNAYDAAARLFLEKPASELPWTKKIELPGVMELKGEEFARNEGNTGGRKKDSVLVKGGDWPVERIVGGGAFEYVVVARRYGVAADVEQCGHALRQIIMHRELYAVVPRGVGSCGNFIGDAQECSRTIEYAGEFAINDFQAGGECGRRCQSGLSERRGICKATAITLLDIKWIVGQQRIEFGMAEGRRGPQQSWQVLDVVQRHGAPHHVVGPVEPVRRQVCLDRA